MHPMKKEGVVGHSRKLREYTRDYGDANPAMKQLARVDRFKKEGEEDAVGYGADSSTVRARSDRPARRSVAANPLATYKRGGSVKAKKRADGGDVSLIEKANRNQAEATPNRARGGRLKGKGTHVNVIVAPQQPAAAPAAPPLPPPMGGPGLPPPMPPKPPLGAGGPPPPMGGPSPIMAGAPGGIPPGLIPPRARGGKVAHEDAKEDKAMIKNMVKPSALKRARGGKVHMTAGSESGPGRLEKIGKKAHDAGRPQTV